ncbi:hypothetical protein Moror_10033 [Moniliophthora roreri MCA 2997]|nr:hypothetical protein Moror_10033 [Moniliophthora roreri MCA 2997]
MKLQARIPAALAALHNFIMENDEENFIPDFRADKDAIDPAPGLHINTEDLPNPHGNLASGSVTQAEYEAGLKQRDDIAQAIWLQYQEVLSMQSEEEVEEYLYEEEELLRGGEEDVEEDGDIE